MNDSANIQRLGRIVRCRVRQVSQSKHIPSTTILHYAKTHYNNVFPIRIMRSENLCIHVYRLGQKLLDIFLGRLLYHLMLYRNLSWFNNIFYNNSGAHVLNITGICHSVMHQSTLLWCRVCFIKIKFGRDSNRIFKTTHRDSCLLILIW